MTLTTEQRKRTEQALAETIALIEKEEGYRVDLQHTDMLDSYRTHRAKLLAMLAS
jgi:hypothetical protein